MTADKGVIKSGTPSTPVVLTCSVTGLETAGATISWWHDNAEITSDVARKYSARKFQG